MSKIFLTSFAAVALACASKPSPITVTGDAGDRLRSPASGAASTRARRPGEAAASCSTCLPRATRPTATSS